MKFLITTYLFVISFCTVFAQKNKIQITDNKTNTGIAFANIYFPELKTGTQTDSAGYFFAPINKNKLAVQITALGYKTLVSEFIFDEKNEIIALEEAHLELDEVMIAASALKLQSENVMNIAALKLNQIAAPMSLSEKLTAIPGVSQISTGGGIGKPVIRGLSGNRVAVFSQGVRVENQQWGDEHGLGLSENGYESVEIIKGPASLLYGSDALGGVIYFVDERYAKDNSTEGKIETKYNTNTVGFDQKVALKISKNKLHFNLFGAYNNNKDYKDGNGFFVPNSRYNTADVKTTLAYTGANFSSAIRYNFLKENYGITEIEEGAPAYKNSRKPDFVYQPLTTQIVSFDNTLFLKDSKIKLTIGNVNNQRLEVGGDSLGNPQTGLGLKTNTTSYNLKYYTPTYKNWEFVLGSQGMFQQNKNISDEVLIPNATTFDIGFFGNASLHYSKNGFLQFGLRFDNRKINSEQNGSLGDEGYKTAFKKDFSSVNFSTGLSQKINEKLTFRANISSGFRAPNTFELLSNGEHEGAFRYEIGDIALKNENSYQLDLELNYKNEHYDFFINPFVNYIKNYIYLVPTDSIAGDLPVYFYKQNNAILFGGESGFHLHPHPLDWLHLESAYSVVYGKNEAGNLPLIPSQRLISTLRTDFKSKSKNINFNAYLQYIVSFRQDNIAIFETKTPAYQLVNLGFGASLKNNISFKIGVNNVFDRTYFDHLSRLKYQGVNGMGRNIFATATVPF